MIEEAVSTIERAVERRGPPPSELEQKRERFDNARRAVERIERDLLRLQGEQENAEKMLRDTRQEYLEKLQTEIARTSDD